MSGNTPAGASPTGPEPLLQVGERTGIYRVTRLNALGPLPAAEILPGHPNAGISVYLTSPLRPLR